MAFWRAFKSPVSWTKLALGEIKQRFLPSSPDVFNKVPMNPYERFKKTINVSNKNYTFFDLPKFGDEYNQLPFSIRVLLESAVRNCDNFQITENDVQNILKWKTNQTIEGGVEVAFKPARVILQDFTGVPAMVDFAAMRDTVKSLGGDPGKINPVCPSDLVIDHSIQADFSREADAQQKNENLEFQRNKERFTFLKWGAKAFKNMLIVPPGSGIVHQVNLEYLARVVFSDKDILYPDSLVGTDSHTTMINGLGVLGWGVGGIEAEAVMLGQAISMLLPQVLGYQLTGTLNQFATSTDLVLTITKHLRQIGVVGKFVEFFGPGVTQLSIADRATISNMCPEYGATVGFFPVDQNTLSYLQQTNRSNEKIAVIKAYLEASKMFRNYEDPSQDPVFSQITTLDLGEVVPSISGPKRPHDRVSVSKAQKDFKSCLTNNIGFKGFQISADKINTSCEFEFNNQKYTIRHGSVVLAAITSCTNTSNPSVMLGAGLLAKNAVEAGLSVAPYIKTSLSPGSGVVTYYLRESGVTPALTALGFDTIGFGCMTCIGNSGPLPEPVVNAIESNELVCCGVLSGNRNFEGRIHPNTRANYLASPLLVIAYAIAGRMDIDFETEPIGNDKNGKPVFLKNIWPSRAEIQSVEKQTVIPAMFQDVYSRIENGSNAWQYLQAPDGQLYPWDESSTYIKNPPFFNGMTKTLPGVQSVKGAHVLLFLGDSVTTDHISPAGNIARNSSAARYLASRNILPKDYNSYGSRRGNDEVMVRGTFANTRIINKLASTTGPKTIHIPSGQELDVFDAAQMYAKEGRPLIAIVGKDYGSGSSRDWAAKGTSLLGIKAVIAESYERIHRSNLVGMGIITLQFRSGENAETLKLTGHEIYDIDIPQNCKPLQEIQVKTNTGVTFDAILRFDTNVDILYHKHGGILNHMIRKVLPP